MTRKTIRIENTRPWPMVLLCLVAVLAVDGFSLCTTTRKSRTRQRAWRTLSPACTSTRMQLSAFETTSPLVVNTTAFIDVRSDNEAQPLVVPSVAASEELVVDPLPDAAIPQPPLELYLKDDDATNNNTNEKFVILALIWCIAFLSALDRVAMSVALVPMTLEFGLSDSLKGSISAFFSVGYGLSILPAGVLLAVTSTRTVVGWGIALWSLATLATPYATEFVMASSILPLLLIRACVGVGESIVVPSLQKLLSVWTSDKEKGLALSFVFSGFHAGTIGAYLLSPLVMDQFFGWRGLFHVYGGVGLLMLVPWLLFAKDAPTAPKMAPAAQWSVEPYKPSFPDAIDTFKDAPWTDFFHSKGTWAMLLAHAAKNWGLYNTLAWTPTFYAEQYGIGVRDSAWLSVLPSIAGVVGGFSAGFLADKVLSNMDDTVQSKTRIRKIFQSIAMFGSAASLGTLALNIPEEAWVAQIYLMMSVGLMAFNAAGFEAGNQEKAGPKWSGLLYSVTSLPAVIVGTTGVYATGRILDATNQDWTLVFSLNAGMNVLGAIAFLALFDSKREFD